jgi:hypothetical protein
MPTASAAPTPPLNPEQHRKLTEALERLDALHRAHCPVCTAPDATAAELPQVRVPNAVHYVDELCRVLGLAEQPLPRLLGAVRGGAR